MTAARRDIFLMTAMISAEQDGSRDQQSYRSDSPIKNRRSTLPCVTYASTKIGFAYLKVLTNLGNSALNEIAEQTTATNKSDGERNNAMTRKETARSKEVSERTTYMEGTCSHGKRVENCNDNERNDSMEVQEWLESENTEALNKDHASLMEAYPTMVLYDILDWHLSRTHRRLARRIDNGVVESNSSLDNQVQSSIIKWWNARQELAATK